MVQVRNDLHRRLVAFVPSVDIYNFTCKRVSARITTVQDGRLSSVLGLNGDLASGMYMANIIARAQSWTEPWVIAP